MATKWVINSSHPNNYKLITDFVATLSKQQHDDKDTHENGIKKQILNQSDKIKENNVLDETVL